MKRKAEIEWDGKTYHLDLPFRFIDKCNERVDLNEAAYRLFAENKRLKHADQAWIIYCALTVNGERVDYETVGEALMEDQAGGNAVVIEIVGTALWGSPKDEPDPDGEGEGESQNSGKGGKKKGGGSKK